MTGRAREAVVVAALAVVLTGVIAAPVLRAPSERIFGMAIVGRHYDPFTVMEQFHQPIRWTAYLQPVTDLPGVVLAQYVGAVASYNALVLFSFPFAAVTAYLLARHCALSPIGAAGAALAVAFSPFHLAHAAYHPHVAQLQWLPLFLLALWRCLDWPTWRTTALLALAVAAVTLSNFYGGLIAAVIAPIALAAYWFFNMRRDTAAVHRLMVTCAALLVVAFAGAGYAFYVAGDLLRGESTLDFARGDLSRYSATWWSYLVPPVAHPWWGGLVRRAGTASGCGPRPPRAATQPRLGADCLERGGRGRVDSASPHRGGAFGGAGSGDPCGLCSAVFAFAADGVVSRDCRCSAPMRGSEVSSS